MKGVQGGTGRQRGRLDGSFWNSQAVQQAGRAQLFLDCMELSDGVGVRVSSQCFAGKDMPLWVRIYMCLVQPETGQRMSRAVGRPMCWAPDPPTPRLHNDPGGAVCRISPAQPKPPGEAQPGPPGLVLSQLPGGYLTSCFLSAHQNLFR